MIRLILVVVIGVLALSYLGVSLRGIVESPAGQQNISYVFELIQNGWDHFFAFLNSFARSHP